MVCLPGMASCAHARLSAYQGHGVSHKALVDGRSLDIWCDNYGVFLKV